MGAKTRSNYAPGYTMTDDDFNRIFRKDTKDESEKQEEGKRETNSRSMEETSETLWRQGSKCKRCRITEQANSKNGNRDTGTSS